METSFYSSKITRTGSLLAETKTFLLNWEDRLTVAQNKEQFRRENTLAKASRQRIDHILLGFGQRYLHSPSVTRALRILVQQELPAASLDRILFFHTCQADLLLHDAVTDILHPLYGRGITEVRVEDVQNGIREWVVAGRTKVLWSESTIRQTAVGILAALRDFHMLEGSNRKHFAPPYLPLQAFAYIAFYLHQEQSSGERLIHHPEWKLFFLPVQSVERLFVEAHQHHLLEYYAAGSVIRVSFPADTLEEYAHVIAARAA